MTFIPKIIVFFLIALSSLLYWASSNVCKYNLALERHTNLINSITEETDPSLGNVKYYSYGDLDCRDINLDWDAERVLNNLRTLSVIVYQALTTDIKGNPN